MLSIIIEGFKNYSRGCTTWNDTPVEKIITYLEKQKPAEWSEEDYDYYDTIVRKLEVIGDDSGLTDNQIKFLREHCPIKQEWSEEDETRRTNAIILLQTPILRKVYQQGEIDKAVEWLRNLRPQPQWKPSDEQI